MKKLHLDKIFGPENVFVDEATCLAYSTDASGVKGSAIAVVFPRNANSVQRLILYASRNSIALVPRGGGSSLVGGAVPNGSIVVDFSKMIKVSNFDPHDKTVYVEPGVILSKLNSFFAKYEMFFPVVPESKDICTIGGMIANNSFGKNAVMYGKTLDNVLSIDFIDGTGKLYTIDPSRHPFVFGSEGSLGFVVGAKLKLSKSPIMHSYDLLETDNLEEIIDAARVFNEKNNVLDLMFISKSVSDIMDFSKKYHLLIKYDDDSGSVFEESDKKEIEKKISSYRFDFDEQGFSIVEDISLEFSKSLYFIKWCEDNSVPLVWDVGNNSFLTFFEINRNDFIATMHSVVANYDGKPTSGYGIGLTKKDYITEYAKNQFIALKNKYDPNRIMNPGKIVGSWTNKERWTD